MKYEEMMMLCTTEISQC